MLHWSRPSTEHNRPHFPVEEIRNLILFNVVKKYTIFVGEGGEFKAGGGGIALVSLVFTDATLRAIGFSSSD